MTAEPRKEHVEWVVTLLIIESRGKTSGATWDAKFGGCIVASGIAVRALTLIVCGCHQRQEVLHAAAALVLIA